MSEKTHKKILKGENVFNHRRIAFNVMEHNYPMREEKTIKSEVNKNGAVLYVRCKYQAKEKEHVNNNGSKNGEINTTSIILNDFATAEWHRCVLKCPRINVACTLTT